MTGKGLSKGVGSFLYGLFLLEMEWGGEEGKIELAG